MCTQSACLSSACLSSALSHLRETGALASAKRKHLTSGRNFGSSILDQSSDPISRFEAWDSKQHNKMALNSDVEWGKDMPRREFELKVVRDIEPMLVQQHYTASRPQFKNWAGRFKNW